MAEEALLTAYHCSYVGGTGAYTASNYANPVYVQAWNSSSTAQISGEGVPVANTSVCLDGGFSGETCTGVITQTNVYFMGTGSCNCGPGTWSSFGIQGHGDSGGPVYYYQPNGQIVAMGFIVGSDTDGSAICPGNNPSTVPEPRGCSSHVFWINIANALAGENRCLLGVPAADTLTQNQSLGSNQIMYPCDGAYQLIMQGDGNLVIYSSIGAIWNTGKHHANDYLLMQGDGNLVMYEPGAAHIPDWYTNTQGHPGARAVIGPGGSLYVISATNQILYDSGSCCGKGT